MAVRRTADLAADPLYAILNTTSHYTPALFY
jgi:hypothetical protein